MRRHFTFGASNEVIPGVHYHIGGALGDCRVSWLMLSSLKHSRGLIQNCWLGPTNLLMSD